MATKIKRPKAKAKVTRKVQRPKKLTYTPLSPVRAFLTLASKAIQITPMTFQYSDGVGTYALALTETEGILECRIKTKTIYRHILPLAELKPDYLDRVEALKMLAVSTAKFTNSKGEGPETAKNITRSKVGNETAKDRQANKNFRQATHAQVHVQSRKASEDMSFGKGPGHIGDLK